MAEEITISVGSKQEQYELLLPQIKALVDGEKDVIANMANITAALKDQFNWLWVGFYLVKEEELVLGPFQGPIACTRIQKGKGVCGTAWKEGQSIIVGDVETFPGHIRCSSLAKSEIVIPLVKGNEILGVLDADHTTIDHFDEIDQQYLEMIIEML
jgi:GAF domain-containing protein